MGDNSAMKTIAIVGSSALEGAPLVERLIEAFRLEGFTVSVIKRAPDGFDIDTPGKGSHARRQAGAREVMMANGERMVLMRENAVRREPDLAALIARLEPVDIVIAEGFHGVKVPTIEALRPSKGRPTRYPKDPNIVALVSDEPLEPLRAPLPTFNLDRLEELADFMAEQVGLMEAP
ncbi:MAG: molybdopterin-guanine dinucleotide biosynthesis protein B [Betaproteobacteria bacterium]